MKKVVFTFLCALHALISAQAVASPIHVFPLWDNSNETISNQMVFSDGNLMLTVTAWTSSYNSSGIQLEQWQQVTGAGLGVFRDEDGLGVISSAGDGNDLDGGESSEYANDPDEGLLFVFSQKVELLDVFVGDLDSSDDINFSNVDFLSMSSLVLGTSVIDEIAPIASSEWPFEFGDEFSGSAFMLWVDGRSDDVEVLGIAVVPEPGSVMLLGLGLLAMSLRRRKF